MAGASAARAADPMAAGRRLFDAIGHFLCEHRLDPDPVNYGFAYAILSDAAGPLATAVRNLTEGGVRLTRSDVESLGCEISDGSATRVRAEGQALVAKTQMQVEGFEDMVRTIRAETQDFGRDLAASADAMRDQASLPLEGIVRVTGAMVERVQAAESRLEAATLEASALREQLEEARDNARRDPLTDLHNRRALEEAFAARSATGATMCLAICDIDHFKDVNDRFGHAVGDRVLKAIGNTLSQACAGQVVARYGGEEFAVLFADVDLATARTTVDAARALVAAKRYRLRDSDAPLGEVTFSAGMTMVTAGEGWSDAFRRADALLYDAKSDGRNCLRVD